MLIPKSQTTAGTFLNTAAGTDVITHPLGYTGLEINQVLVITVGIDPAGPDATSMIHATRQAVATWNALLPELNNEVPVGESQVPQSQLDFESSSCT